MAIRMSAFETLGKGHLLEFALRPCLSCRHY